MTKLSFGLLGLTMTSGLALAAVSAKAADIYVPGPGGYKDGPCCAATWAGFYVGVSGGYGWSNSDNQLADSVFSFKGLSPSGGFGGGQVGYNWQRDRLVFGVEADFQGADIGNSSPVPDIGGTAHFSSKMDWFGTVRGRIGYAFDRTLVYATGGFAYGEVDNKVAFSPGVTYRSNGTETGYVIGGGIEYKIAPAWSIKGEYQYINLGKNDPIAPGGTKFSSFAGNVVNEDAFHTVRVGLNYHFLPAYEPLK